MGLQVEALAHSQLMVLDHRLLEHHLLYLVVEAVTAKELTLVRQMMSPLVPAVPEEAVLPSEVALV